MTKAGHPSVTCVAWHNLRMPPSDGCVAVFRPERPDIATFRPRPAA